MFLSNEGKLRQAIHSIYANEQTRSAEIEVKSNSVIIDLFFDRSIWDNLTSENKENWKTTLCNTILLLMKKIGYKLDEENFYAQISLSNKKSIKLHLDIGLNQIDETLTPGILVDIIKNNYEKFERKHPNFSQEVYNNVSNSCTLLLNNYGNGLKAIYAKEIKNEIKGILVLLNDDNNDSFLICGPEEILKGIQH
jgi:hypothetical protein